MLDFIANIDRILPIEDVSVVLSTRWLSIKGLIEEFDVDEAILRNIKKESVIF